MGLPRESEHMHLGRPKEEAAEDDTAEIGKVVGISTKNVSVRLFRIKEQLKNMSEE